MKRLVTVMGIMVLAGAIAVPVLAYGPGWGRGPSMMGYWGGGPGYGYCTGYGPGAASLTEDQGKALDNLHRKFYDETAPLRNEIWGKKRELADVLNAPNPDAEKARALQKEINDLKASLAEKRLNFELEERKIVPEARSGRGYGRGYGWHMGGYGPGMGWGPRMGYGPRMGGYGYGPGAGTCWQ